MKEEATGLVRGRAKGGIARAEKLSAEEKSAIAKKAAAARWQATDVEVAKLSGEIKIGDITIPCAVMEDGTRLLSERALTKAFGGKRGGAHWRRLKENPDGAYLPIFMSAANIKEQIPEDLAEHLGRRRVYRAKTGGVPAYGLEATLLPKMCDVLLKMKDDSTLKGMQIPIGKQADIIMRGLAHVGIVALVDEATGYIHEKRKDEYREQFNIFIRDQVREWEKEFPRQFTDNLYRLYELENPKTGRHPQFFGKLTRKYIWKPLANSNGAILEMLDEKNPVVTAKGGRRYKFHQFLTEVVGLPMFRAHLWQVVGLLNGAASRSSFERSFQRAFPTPGTQYTLLDEDEK